MCAFRESDQVVMTLAAFVELFSILAIFLATAPVRTVSKRGVVGGGLNNLVAAFCL